MLYNKNIIIKYYKNCLYILQGTIWIRNGTEWLVYYLQITNFIKKGKSFCKKNNLIENITKKSVQVFFCFLIILKKKLKWKILCFDKLTKTGIKPL